MPRVFKTDHLKKSIIYKRGRKFSLHIIIKVKLFNLTSFFFIKERQSWLNFNYHERFTSLNLSWKYTTFLQNRTHFSFFLYIWSFPWVYFTEKAWQVKTNNWLDPVYRKEIMRTSQVQIIQKINLKLNYITLKECKKRLCYNFKVTIQLHIWDL